MDTTLNRFIKAKNELYSMQFIQSKSVKAGSIKYEYFELSDFMPKIIESCIKHNILQYFTIENDSLYVRGKIIISREDDNTDIINFPSCPYPIALIKNPKDLGSISTYIQRYTYIKTFGITEDCKMEQQIAKETNLEIKIIHEINKILRQAGRPTRTEKDLKEHAKSTGNNLEWVLNSIAKKYRKK